MVEAIYKNPTIIGEIIRLDAPLDYDTALNAQTLPPRTDHDWREPTAPAEGTRFTSAGFPAGSTCR